MRDREQGRLVQGLGLTTSVALVTGNIIGSGIYVIPASLADAAFGPVAGAIAATLYWISCVVGNAAFITAFVGYAAVFVPAFHEPLPAFLLAQVLLWTLTLVNAGGVVVG